ncbi:DUF502 domain-containing protein [Flavobacterium ajazii]|uniref:hypothetical protein n=1 Tax=Flavobacterium ajazii TaxID=2692318 RepID=UPI0013D5173D|nr:hypothetical protein [Flavobacterium ajazii]
MKKFFKQAERNFISGALVLLPLIVFFVIMQKIWSFFQTYGEKAAHFLRLDDILGIAARDIVGGFFLVVLFYFSGYLMRLAFLKKFTSWIDNQLMIFLPGYEKNKKIAEEKLNAKVKKSNTDLPILLKFGEYWQPALLKEESDQEKAVVFVPTVPFSDHGQIYIVNSDLIKRLPHTSVEDFNASLKSCGKGILDFN